MSTVYVTELQQLSLKFRNWSWSVLRLFYQVFSMPKRRRLQDKQPNFRQTSCIFNFDPITLFTETQNLAPR